MTWEPTMIFKMLFGGGSNVSHKPDYSTIEIPPGEPEIRMDVAYSTQKMPEFVKEYDCAPGEGMFTTSLFHVATVTVFFNDVAKASIRKLGLHERELAASIEAVTDRKTQKRYQDAPHIYQRLGWISPFELHRKITPETAFDKPVKLWRKQNADLQTAVLQLKNQLAALKDRLPAARTGDRQSFEI